MCVNLNFTQKLGLFLTVTTAVLYPLLTSKHPAPCITAWCPLQTAACVGDTACRDTLWVRFYMTRMKITSCVQCMSSCEGRDDLSKCQFDCEMTLGRDSEEFVHLLQCMSANDCFPEVIMSENPLLQEFFSLKATIELHLSVALVTLVCHQTSSNVFKCY